MCFNRSDQLGCKAYSKVQGARSEDYSEELQFVQTFYGSDFDPVQLSTHLELFSKVFYLSEKVTLSDILVFFRGGSCQVYLISQVGKLLMRLLVIPATNAQSERSLGAV